MRLIRRAQSSLEFIALITFMLTVFLVFQKFITRGFVGRWQATGDTWGHGRQYDPALTVNCQFEPAGKFWYDSAKFETDGCRAACYHTGSSKAACDACKAGARTAVCDDTVSPPAL